jgi:hypothetical protein
MTGEGRPGVDLVVNFSLDGRSPGLFGMPLRQTTGFVQSFLRLAGLDWSVPNFSTLCRRQQKLNVAIPYRRWKGPLSLLIGSMGIEAEGEGE